MLTPQQESYILAHGYVPEHCVSLITSLSAGEPFLLEDFFYCRKDDWIIFIGYSLQNQFDPNHMEAVIQEIKHHFKPARISLIAPSLTHHLTANCKERDSDYYFTLETKDPVIRSPIRRNLRKAARHLTLERTTHMGAAHRKLMHEFVRNINPPERVENLLFKMPDYVGTTPHSFVLNAWSVNDQLAAFYVVDFAVRDFASYIIGCHSRENYVLGASDLLMMRLIELSAEYGKAYIHLGLGINQGVRRFKEKWGARPSRRYEMCELLFKKPLIWEAIRSLAGRVILKR
jgi:hypothetical protein